MTSLVVQPGGQMCVRLSVCLSVRPSVRVCAVNIFKTPRLRDRWPDADQTWQTYSVSLQTQLLSEAEFNFGWCVAQGPRT